MKENLFEFITKMYSDLTHRLDKIDLRLDGKADMKDIVLLENKIDLNSKALFDGYKQVYEKLDVIEKKLDEISQNVDEQVLK